jgi:uncharacterized protein (DUF1499 family)
VRLTGRDLSLTLFVRGPSLRFYPYNLGIYLRMFFYLIVLAAVAFVIYVRIAPTEPAQWHISIDADADKDMKGGAIRIVTKADDTMKTLDQTISGLARTTLLAGSAEEGHVTYVTRSKWIGFPDYTTIEASGETIKMFARLRFGRADLGVNAARLRKLMQAID